EAADQECLKSELQLKANELLRDVARYAPTGVDRLAAELAEIEKQIKQLPIAEAKPAAADGQNAEPALQQARRKRHACKQELQTARAKSQQSSQKFADTNGKIQTRSGEETACRTAAKTSEEKLAQMRAEESDGDLEQRLMESRHLKEAATKQRTELETKLQG